jgi:uncharacterized protein
MTATSKNLQELHSLQLLPLDKLHRNDWNPNFMANAVRESIKKNISQRGFNGVILVQKRNERMQKDNVIIDGENRTAILKELGYKEAPCYVLDITEEEARALTVRINREHGEIMPDKLARLLKETSVNPATMPDADRLAELFGMTKRELDIYRALNIPDEAIAKAVASESAAPQVRPMDGDDLGLKISRDGATVTVGWEGIEKLVKKTSRRFGEGQFDAVIAVTKGGIIPAVLMARELKIDKVLMFDPKEPAAYGFKADPQLDYLVVDDIFDSGKTFEKIKQAMKDVRLRFAFLFSRNHIDFKTPENARRMVIGHTLGHSAWLVFPWESREQQNT